MTLPIDMPAPDRHNLAIEFAVLGAIMLERDALGKVVDILIPEVFYSPRNKVIYRAAIDLRNEGWPVDLLTVFERIQRMDEVRLFADPGLAYYLTELTSGVASAANIEYHSHLLLEYYMTRETARISHDTQRSLAIKDADPFEVIEALQGRTKALLERNVTQASRFIRDGLTPMLDKLLSRVRGETKLIGLSSGFESVDKLSWGFQPGNLIILAGRPAMGKTAFALALTRNITVTHNIPVLFISLEMTEEELQTRLIISESNYDLGRAGLNPDVDAQMIMQKLDGLYKAPLLVNDKSPMTIHEISTEARRAVKQHGIEMLVLDYLQLIASTGKEGNREQEVSAASGGLKQLAKELKIPIIALSQLSRETAKRAGDKRPVMTDLRESGSIEQDADVVMFLHRPEYYNITETQDGLSTRGLCEVIFEKQRNGALGTANLNFTIQTGRFSEYEIDSQYSQQTKANF